MSSFIELAGETQDVAAGGKVLFTESENVGKSFVFTGPGDTVTITQPGLYLVEWSINLGSGNTDEAEYCLIENGTPTSPAASSAPVGNHGSGALINVTTVPYTISLRNSGANTSQLEEIISTNSAASMRIVRFADGAVK